MATTTKTTTTSDTTDQVASTVKKPITDTTNTPLKEKPSVTSKATTPENTDTTTDGQPLGISQDVKEKISKEINDMLSFASYNGIIINTDVITLIQNSSVDNLVNAHNMLSLNVAPATPKSIAYTRKLREDSTKKTLFSKLPLVRNLIILSLLFLGVFILTGSSPNVNNESLDLGVMNNHGVPLLLNLAFLASISGLGVLFYLLRNVSTSVKNGNLVPEDSIYYIALIVLGVIAGLIMSEILNLYTNDPENINLFNKSVLALLGGFSADAIFTILQGLIDRLKSIFAPVKS